MPYDFKQAAGIKPSKKGEYLEPVKVPAVIDPTTKQVLTPESETPGEFLLEIIRNTSFTTRDQKKKWVAEFKVLESNHPAIPVGSMRNFMQDLMDPEVGFRGVKGLLYAALGLDYRNPEHEKLIETEIEPKIGDVLAEAIDDPTDPACKNALAGKKVKCTVKTIMTKKANKPFGLHTFRPAA